MFVPQHDLQDFLRTAELLEIKGLLKDDAAWPPQGLASLFQAPVSPGPSQKQHIPTLPTVPVSSFLLPTATTTPIVSGHIEGIFEKLRSSNLRSNKLHWCIPFNCNDSPSNCAPVNCVPVCCSPVNCGPVNCAPVNCDSVNCAQAKSVVCSITINLTILGTQINDLVSQIKVPVTLPSQPVSKTLLTSNSAGSLQGGSAEKRRKIEIVNRRNPSNITLVNNSQQTKARRLLTTTNNAVTTQIVVEDSSVSRNDA